MQDNALRNSIIQYACKMHVDRLTVANSGNISSRNDEGFLITPSGVPYEQLGLEDIVQLNLDGQNKSGLIPSSEWRIHADLYRHRPEIKAIVHAHSPSATALSTLRKPVPSFHYMVSVLGGSQIPCADYATFGTQALSANVLKAIEGYKGCLMANHGMIVVGNSLDEAYRLALELESLCSQYSEATRLGQICLLTEEEMAEAKAAFAQYGQKKNKDNK